MGAHGRPLRSPRRPTRTRVPALRRTGGVDLTRPAALTELDDIDAVFTALAHETRRHVLLVLHARGDAMTAGELASRFACSWPTTTRHLQRLLDAGLVVVERRGRERRYTLDADRLRHVTSLYLDAFT